MLRPEGIIVVTKENNDKTPSPPLPSTKKESECTTKKEMNEILLPVFILIIGLLLLYLRFKFKFTDESTLTNYRLVIFGVLCVLLGLLSIIYYIINGHL
jgi:hypothetical protein